MVRLYVVRSTCRVCDSSDLEPVLSFGNVPLAGTLLAPPQLIRDEAMYPLDVVFCRNCSLLQTIETVSPAALQDGSLRRVDASAPSEGDEERALADRLVDERNLGPDSLVIEIASHDGQLLRHFKERHVSVLGIEPWSTPANRAREAGVPTLAAFFTRDLAQYLKSEDKQADVLIARNVLCRIPDLHGFLDGIRILLKTDGMALIEVPYVRRLVEDNAFEQLNHEQLSYFSLSALVEVLEGSRLWPGKIELLGPHGSVLRLLAVARRDETSSVPEYVKAEASEGIGTADYYRQFSRRAEITRGLLRSQLRGLRRDGKRVVAYGATAEATTLLNYAGLDHEYIEYVVDDDPQRQGRFVPGVHLPVLSPDSILADIPDYLLLLDRGHDDSLEAIRPALERAGTQFIVPAR